MTKMNEAIGLILEARLTLYNAIHRLEKLEKTKVVLVKDVKRVIQEIVRDGAKEENILKELKIWDTKDSSQEEEVQEDTK